MNKLDISVVVPLYNEAESLPELVAWIDRVAAEHGYTYEVERRRITQKAVSGGAGNRVRP